MRFLAHVSVHLCRRLVASLNELERRSIRLKNRDRTIVGRKYDHTIVLDDMADADIDCDEVGKDDRVVGNRGQCRQNVLTPFGEQGIRRPPGPSHEFAQPWYARSYVEM